MPLRDHFHAPLGVRRRWEGFYSAWASTIVQELGLRRLPAPFWAEPHVQRGVAREDDGVGEEMPGVNWAPSVPEQTSAVDFPAQDAFEIRTYDVQRSGKLVAVVAFVSPGNKDRPENRRAFAIKCAGYLQQRVALVIVDVVTEGHANLHAELTELLGLTASPPWPEGTSLYAVAYRTAKENGEWRMEIWAEALALGAALPTLPLWLASNLAVPLELEPSYEETCRVLRIT